MSDFIPAPIAQLPWKTILLLFVMASFGFVVLYSAAGGSVSPWAGLHMGRFGVFLAMAVVMSRFKESFWKTMAFPTYIVIVIMLVGVELLGAVGGGSQRWLNLGFIRIQPSELMKVAIMRLGANSITAPAARSGPGARSGRFSRCWPCPVPSFCCSPISAPRSRYSSAR